MVHTVTRMVHAGSRIAWAMSFAMHILGGALGGAATAAFAFAALGIVGIGETARFVAALVVVGAAFLLDANALPVRVPSPRRQVPERWREYFRPPTTALLYGVGLGTGVTTRVYFATTYAVFIGSALTVSFAETLEIGAIYGVSRSAGVWIAYSAESLESLRAALWRREGHRRVVKIANLASLAVLAFVLAT